MKFLKELYLKMRNDNPEADWQRFPFQGPAGAEVWVDLRDMNTDQYKQVMLVIGGRAAIIKDERTYPSNTIAGGQPWLKK